LIETDGVLGKQCTCCDTWKPLNEFNNQKNGLGGKSSKCKKCLTYYHREYNKGTVEKRRQYYLDNLDHIKEYRKERYQNERDKILKERNEMSQEDRDKLNQRRRELYPKHREKLIEKAREYAENNKEKVREYRKSHYIKNREEYREKGILYREKNKEKIRLAKRKYYHEKPEKDKLKNMNRRAADKGLRNDLTGEEKHEIETHFGGCALTGCQEFDWDHVIPLNIGHGGTNRCNLIPLRSDLNASKGIKNIFEWFEANRQRFELSQEKFDLLVAWLASANAVSVEDYRDYVYWCHENPHSLEDLRKDDEGEAI
jgi:hypothetical protein